MIKHKAVAFDLFGTLTQSWPPGRDRQTMEEIVRNREVLNRYWMKTNGRAADGVISPDRRTRGEEEK